MQFLKVAVNFPKKGSVLERVELASLSGFSRCPSSVVRGYELESIVLNKTADRDNNQMSFVRSAQQPTFRPIEGDTWFASETSFSRLYSWSTFNIEESLKKRVVRVLFYSELLL